MKAGLCCIQHQTNLHVSPLTLNTPTTFMSRRSSLLMTLSAHLRGLVAAALQPNATLGGCCRRAEILLLPNHFWRGVNTASWGTYHIAPKWRYIDLDVTHTDTNVTTRVLLILHFKWLALSRSKFKCGVAITRILWIRILRKCCELRVLDPWS